MASIINGYKGMDANKPVGEYKDISNEQLKAMSTFCSSTLEKNHYTKRVKAAKIIQRKVKQYNKSERQKLKRKYRYNIRLRNFFEQGCSISPLECAGNVPVISSFHQVQTSVMKNRMVQENDEVIFINGVNLIGKSFKEALQIVIKHRRELANEGTPMALRMRRDGTDTIYKVLFQHFQLPLGINLIPNPNISHDDINNTNTRSNTTSNNTSSSNANNSSRSKAKALVNRVVRRFSKSKLYHSSLSSFTPIQNATKDKVEQSKFKKYSKLDIRNYSPIVVGPLLPVRGALEESGISVGDQIIWIDNYGSTLSKSYTDNIKALLKTSEKSTLVTFQRFSLKIERIDVLNALDMAERIQTKLRNREVKLHDNVVNDGDANSNLVNTLTTKRNAEDGGKKTSETATSSEIKFKIKEELKAKGIQVFKHPRKGKPEKRLIWLSEDESRLEISKSLEISTNGSTKKGIFVKDILLISKGCQSDIFQRNKTFIISEKLCFSLVVVGRTFDFELLCMESDNKLLMMKRDVLVQLLQELCG